jgi:hypothetical protein
MEVSIATLIGERRQAEAARKGLRDRHGFKGNGKQIHIEGVAGEIAVAKSLNVYYPATVNTFKKGSDLLYGLEVRTRSKHDYDLIVRLDDKNGSCFVLVTGGMPTFQVHGYIIGRNAKKVEWRQTYGGREPAYFVPQNRLKPLWRLCERIAARRKRSLINSV